MVDRGIRNTLYGILIAQCTLYFVPVQRKGTIKKDSANFTGISDAHTPRRLTLICQTRLNTFNFNRRTGGYEQDFKEFPMTFRFKNNSSLYDLK